MCIRMLNVLQFATPHKYAQTDSCRRPAAISSTIILSISCAQHCCASEGVALRERASFATVPLLACALPLLACTAQCLS